LAAAEGSSFVSIVSSPTVPATAGFTSLQLHPLLLKAIAAEGYETPTPIQAQAIPPALAGRDLLGIAQTGTGKTAAFALPLLHALLEGHEPGTALPPRRRPRVLVLSPTRELAAQIGESFATYGRRSGLRGTVIFGGVGQNPQAKAIAAGLDVVVATPGRLMDLMGQGLVDLREVRHLVLDEADRMLDMGFIEPIRRIVAALPRGRRTMLFSATMPREIEHLAAELLRDPVRVEVTPVATTVERIEQRIYGVGQSDKPRLLAHLIRSENATRAVVFTKTKHGADRVLKQLRAAGIDGEAIHGNKAQNQRTRALDSFRSGRVTVLVATDVAARGLDVDGITHVFNYDLPVEPEAYVHRIGRTARAGASGTAIAFCDAAERGLLRAIERLIRQEIPRGEAPAGFVAPPVELEVAPRRGGDGGRGHGRNGSGGHGGRGGRGGHGGHGGPRSSRRSGTPKREGVSHREGGGSSSREGAGAATAVAVAPSGSASWKRPRSRMGGGVGAGRR